MQSFEQKMAAVWRKKFIAAAGDIADQGGSRVASRHLRECEENALKHLLYWEERLSRAGHDLGAEMDNPEPNRPRAH